MLYYLIRLITASSTSLLCFFEHIARPTILTLHLLPSILREYLSLEGVNQSLRNERQVDLLKTAGACSLVRVQLTFGSLWEFRDDSFGVMRFDFDLILTLFYTRNWVKNESKLNRITPKESSLGMLNI